MPKYLMPVGNTDFKEIRETGLYYIDKTMLIDQLVGQCCNISLIAEKKVIHYLMVWKYPKTKNYVIVG